MQVYAHQEPWLIDEFTKYVSGSRYVSIYCLKIDAGISSFPWRRFFNVLITIIITFLYMSGIYILGIFVFM